MKSGYYPQKVPLNLFETRSTSTGPDIILVMFMLARRQRCCSSSLCCAVNKRQTLTDQFDLTVVFSDDASALIFFSVPGSRNAPPGKFGEPLDTLFPLH